MCRRNSARLAALLIVLHACTDPTGPTNQLDIVPDDPAFAILDANHDSSVKGFYFLPPLVPPPAFKGQFDPNQSTEVRVVCTGATGPQCPVVKAMTANVILSEEMYSATWKPSKAEKQVELGPDKYRVEVYIGQELLGYADLWFVSKKPELMSVGSGYVGVVAGQQLKVNFRIETGQFPGNNPPVASNDEFETDQDTPLSGNVLENDSDPDGDAFSAVLATPPANGTLQLNDDGSFEYTPAAGFSGMDSFTYRASDGTLVSNLATVSITVNSLNQRPFYKRQAAGFQHTCALDSSGRAYCWGDNNSGQLGNGGSGVVGSSGPVAVTGGHTFVQLVAGLGHNCGLTATGAAYCWGGNGLGQLGDGGPGGGISASPMPVVGGHSFAELAAGAFHTCGITSSGAAYCWGANTYGQLGTSVAPWTSTPLPVEGGHTFTRIEAGGSNSTCALDVSGAAYCWGAGGTLGNGHFDNQFAPVPVLGGHRFTDLAVGGGHTCGVTITGAAYCWGYNGYGQIGDGTLDHAWIPVAVTGGLTLVRVAPGLEHSCGVVISGATYCWGNNANGQLGIGAFGAPQTTPMAVAGGHVFVELAAGGGHTCGRKDAGAMFCWGSGAQGQLGNGGVQSLVPVPTVPFE